MYLDDDDARPRPPRTEPEILPPERPEDRGRAAPHPAFAQQRLVFAAPGPLGVLLALVGLGAIAVIGVVLFLGLVLLWIPVVGALAAGFIIAALLRGARR